MAEQTPASGSSQESLWSLVIKNSALFAAILYFAGWVYLYYFFKSFEIDVSQLELGWTDTLVYSGVLEREVVNRIFSLSIWPVAVIGLGVLFLVLDKAPGTWAGVATASGKINASYYFPLLIALAAVYLIVAFARGAGLQAAHEVRIGTGNAVELRFDAKKCELPANSPLKLLNDGGKLKLLFSTPKKVFVFSQTGGWEANRQEISVVRVMQVPSDCLLAVETTVRPTREVQQ